MKSKAGLVCFAATVALSQLAQAGGGIFNIQNTNATGVSYVFTPGGAVPATFEYSVEPSGPMSFPNTVILDNHRVSSVTWTAPAGSHFQITPPTDGDYASPQLSFGITYDGSTTGLVAFSSTYAFSGLTGTAPTMSASNDLTTAASLTLGYGFTATQPFTFTSFKETFSFNSNIFGTFALDPDSFLTYSGIGLDTSSDPYALDPAGLTIVAAPEPGSLALLAGAGMLVAGIKRLRRSNG